MLQVNPDRRLTAQAALEHPWILRRRRTSPGAVDRGVAEALVAFGQSPKFRRCCLELLAWSLSTTDRAKVHDQFLSMDTEGKGTITRAQLKAVMTAKLRIPEPEAEVVFASMDSNHNDEVNYSEFLAAMVSTCIELHNSPVLALFRKFDRDNSGYVTAHGLRAVLGEGFEAEAMLDTADLDRDGRLSFPEFYSFLQGSPAAASARPPLVLRAASVLFGVLRFSPFRCCVRPAPARGEGQ
uniref:EF-hand domain-containing protein n=1 Tax=Alexandrium catenella TaxID=2925 RepID=A0A7S1S1C0_ALECA